jgi:hypothetical protein
MFLTNNHKFFSFQKMFHVKHYPWSAGVVRETRSKPRPFVITNRDTRSALHGLFYIFSLQIPVTCDFVITNPLIVITNAVWVPWGDKNIIF